MLYKVEMRPRQEAPEVAAGKVAGSTGKDRVWKAAGLTAGLGRVRSTQVTCCLLRQASLSEVQLSQQRWDNAAYTEDY